MNILIVDDDANLLAGLKRKLRCDDWILDSAESGEDALEKAFSCDMLVTDLRLPGMDGIELIRHAKEKNPRIEVVVMTGYGTIPSAVAAMRDGARAYLTKPFDTEELRCHIRDVQKLLEFRRIAGKYGRGELVGGSRAMEHVYTEIDVAAASMAPTLITGETGTGKELAARAVHKLSGRREAPFITVNLGAIPSELAESELFGHVQGAFTGAAASRKGRFQLARNGTLFLDEIDSLPLALQPKLLRAVETKEVWAVGSEKPETIDFRIVAAANSPMENLVEKKKFRNDLFYRLNVIRIHMPPLREHPEDIPQIAGAIIERLQKRNADETNIRISPETLTTLIRQPWPGNVRELSNIIERAYARLSATHASPAQDLVLDLSCIGDKTFANYRSKIPFKEAKEKASDEWTSKTIADALIETKGNITHAAKLLQMNRSAMMRLMKRLDLHPEMPE